MGIRRKAREIALQTLYSLDFEELNPMLQEVELISRYPEKLAMIIKDENMKDDSNIVSFADFLLQNTLSHILEIDEIIDKHSKHWSLDRIAILDKNILRIAVGEILFTDTPAAIIMNEAIEIAKKYCSENSSKFVNGILNAIKDANL